MNKIKSTLRPNSSCGSAIVAPTFASRRPKLFNKKKWIKIHQEMAEIRPRVVKHSAVSAQIFELKEQAHFFLTMVKSTLRPNLSC